MNGRRGLPSTSGISRDHAGLNSARNAGIAAALGDPVCFVDDDINVPTTWLSSMVAALLRHPGPVCVGGAIRLELEVPPPRVCERHSIGESELDLGPVERPATVVWGANMSMWRAAFLTAGTFDERLLIGGEDTEWERRLVAAGGCVIYAPDAWLLHRRMAADLTLASLLRRTFRRGLSCGRNTVHTGERQRYPEAAGRILGYLRHAATDRCSFGLICTSMSIGFLLGQAGRRWTGRLCGQRSRR